jgi:hypothetical protein
MPYWAIHYNKIIIQLLSSMASQKYFKLLRAYFNVLFSLRIFFIRVLKSGNGRSLLRWFVQNIVFSLLYIIVAITLATALTL